MVETLIDLLQLMQPLVALPTIHFRGPNITRRSLTAKIKHNEAYEKGLQVGSWLIPAFGYGARLGHCRSRRANLDVIVFTDHY